MPGDGQQLSRALLKRSRSVYALISSLTLNPSSERACSRREASYLPRSGTTPISRAWRLCRSIFTLNGMEFQFLVATISAHCNLCPRALRLLAGITGTASLRNSGVHACSLASTTETRSFQTSALTSPPRFHFKLLSSRQEAISTLS